MDSRYLRIAYAVEFCVAIVAVLALWQEVGGQTHFDLVPWWVKLVFTLMAAYAAVRATVASVASERAFDGRTLRWISVLIVVLIGCGMASLWGHLNEPVDQQEEPTAVSRIWDSPQRHGTENS